MIDVNGLTDKFLNSSAYYGTIGAVTGIFLGLVGLYFHEEYLKYKKAAEENKSKNNLEGTLNKEQNERRT